MTINIDKVLKIGGTIGGILMLFFGVSLAAVLTQGKEVWGCPDRVDKLEALVIEQDSIIKALIHGQHMSWEFGRLITDNPDSTDIYNVINWGKSFEVDIRETAEEVGLAFVFGLHNSYKIRIADADGRKYIMLQDLQKDENQNAYLYKRGQ